MPFNIMWQYIEPRLDDKVLMPTLRRLTQYATLFFIGNITQTRRFSRFVFNIRVTCSSAESDVSTIAIVSGFYRSISGADCADRTSDTGAIVYALSESIWPFVLAIAGGCIDAVVRTGDYGLLYNDRATNSNG